MNDSRMLGILLPVLLAGSGLEDELDWKEAAISRKPVGCGF